MDHMEFIKKARQIETMVYKQQELCNQLNETLKNRKQKQQQEFIDLLPAQDYSPHYAYRKAIGRVVGTFIGMGIGLFRGLSILSESKAARRAAYNIDGIIRLGASESAETEATIVMIVAIVIGFMVGFLFDILLYRFSLHAENVDDEIVDMKNEKIAEENKEITSKNEILKSEHKAQNMAFQQEIYRGYDVLKGMFDLKTAFYKSAPYYIDPKYQNIVAITTFDSYLTTRRCTELDGYMGVFNVYEQDRQFGLIMTKMDTIIDKLDTISAYQSTLISLAKQTNREIAALTDLVDNRTQKISSQLDRIEDNTYLSQHYGEINADMQMYRMWVDSWKM